MATQDDVRRIALALPGVIEEAGGFAFNVAAASKQKNIVWAWRERIHPKKSRVPSTKVIAIRVANELEKQALLSADERKFFTEPHYDGYPAVLVNLEEVTVGELEPLICEAWRCRAPKQLIDGPPAPTKKATGSRSVNARSVTNKAAKKPARNKLLPARQASVNEVASKKRPSK
jgi:hypothetical protein